VSGLRNCGALGVELNHGLRTLLLRRIHWTLG
jgi:hypothetical protein